MTKFRYALPTVALITLVACGAPVEEAAMTEAAASAASGAGAFVNGVAFRISPTTLLGPIYLRFDRPMDPAAVEAHLFTHPPTSGTLTWSGPTRAVYQVHRVRRGTTALALYVDRGALAADGTPQPARYRNLYTPPGSKAASCVLQIDSPSAGQESSEPPLLQWRDNCVTSHLRLVTPSGSVDTGAHPNGELRMSDALYRELIRDGVGTVSFTARGDAPSGKHLASSPRTFKLVRFALMGQTFNPPAALDVTPGYEGHAQDVSANGELVAYVTSAKLSAQDTNNTSDVFVFDRSSGMTEQVSVTANGVAIGGKNARMSGDGRFVVFERVVYPYGIYLHDRDDGSTTKIATGNYPVISGDGRFVAHRQGSALKLIDRDAGSVTTVAGGISGYTKAPVALSDDGTTLAFISSASTLVDDDTNNGPDVFVYGIDTGAIERVSVTSDGMQAYALYPRQVDISASGRHVVWSGKHLVADSNKFEILAHDRLAGITEQLSFDTDQTDLAGASFTGNRYEPRISGNGRFVVFRDWAGCAAGKCDNSYVRVRDRRRGDTVSRQAFATGGVLSADGQSVAYTNTQPQLSADKALALEHNPFLRGHLHFEH